MSVSKSLLAQSTVYFICTTRMQACYCQLKGTTEVVPTTDTQRLSELHTTRYASLLIQCGTVFNIIEAQGDCQFKLFTVIAYLTHSPVCLFPRPMFYVNMQNSFVIYSLYCKKRCAIIRSIQLVCGTSPFFYPRFNPT